MKSLLAAISIISIACGYIIGESSSSSSKETQSSPSVVVRHDRSKSRDTRARNDGDNALLDSILGGRSISEIPTADLAGIYMKLSKHDPNADDFSRAEQSYQLQLFLAKLSATDLTNIANELSSDSNMNSYLITGIISALAEKDPTRALDWVSKHDSSSALYQVVLSTIADNDPITASSLLKSAIIDGKIAKGRSSEFIQYKIARSIAKLGADPFFDHLDSMPKELQEPLLSYVIENIPKSDHIKLLDQVHQRLQDGKLSDYDINSSFSEVITQNKAAATEWLKKLPENEEKNMLRIKAAQYLFKNGDKESAIGWMKEAIATTPGREKRIIQIAIQNLLYENPETIPAIANLLPEGVKFTANDIHYSTDNGYEGFPALASAFSDPNEKSIFVADSLKKISQAADSGSLKMNSSDLDIISRQITAMGFTGQNAARVNEAIAALIGKASPTNR